MKATIISSNKNQAEIKYESPTELRVSLVTWFIQNGLLLTDKAVYNADKDLFLAITGKEDCCMVGESVVNFTY
jgi:hypothetical protein